MNNKENQYIQGSNMLADNLSREDVYQILKHERINTAITKLIELTKLGALRWERVWGGGCSFRSIGPEPCLVVSCCQPIYRLKRKDKILIGITHDELVPLCAEINRQIDTQMDETVSVLQDMINNAQWPGF